jgi:hypothetical protein
MDKIPFVIGIFALWYGIPLWAKLRMMDRNMPKASEWTTWLTIFFLGPLTIFFLIQTFFVPRTKK